MAGQPGSENRKCCHDAVERLSEDAGRNESGLSGPGDDRPEDPDTDSARRPVLLAPESSGRRRARTVVVFQQNPSTATSGRDGRPRGSVGFVGGKTSEGRNPRGVTGAKQSRKGIGRSNASRGRESLQTLHSRARQTRRRSLPAASSAKGARNLMRGCCFGSSPPWVTLRSGAQVHERMRGCFAHPSQERSGRPQRSVRKTKTREGGPNQ